MIRDRGYKNSGPRPGDSKTVGAYYYIMNIQKLFQSIADSATLLKSCVAEPVITYNL